MCMNLLLICRFDAVAIGGIRQKNNFSLEVDPKDREGILERCYKLWPSLRVRSLQSTVTYKYWNICMLLFS